MGLRLKFNLVMLVVFIVGLVGTGYLSYELLHRNARDEVLRNAGVMMEAALSMRGYTVGKVRPLLPHDPDKFLPESVPAFAATEIMWVPMALPIRNANRAFVTFMSSLTVVFAVLFVLLNVMLTILIVQPITQLSMTAEQMSKGRLDVPDFSDKGRDEVSQLGQAFNRMRRSLDKAITR